MPPSQAGMVPAALPPFSAPTGVSSRPSLAASSALTAAWAMPVASTAAPAIAARVNVCLVFILCLPVASAGTLDGERREVAVVDLVVALGAADAGVGQAARELVRVGGLQARGQRRAALEEVATRAGGDAVDVVVEGDARRQVDRAAEHARVLGAGRQAVTRGERGREAAVQRQRVAHAAERSEERRVGKERRAGGLRRQYADDGSR